MYIYHYFNTIYMYNTIYHYFNTIHTFTLC